MSLPVDKEAKGFALWRFDIPLSRAGDSGANPQVQTTEGTIEDQTVTARLATQFSMSRQARQFRLPVDQEETSLALWRVNTPLVQSREPRAGSLTVEKSKEVQGAVNPPTVGGDKRALRAKIIGFGVSTSEKKTPTEDGYAQELQAGDNSSKPQGIEPDVSPNRSRPTEAGYSQGTPEEIFGKRQEIEPVSLSRGEKLDNTDLQSVQQKLLNEVENLTAKRTA